MSFGAHLVSPFEGKPMLSKGSRSTGLRRCHGPDGPLAGMVDVSPRWPIGVTLDAYEQADLRSRW